MVAYLPPDKSELRHIAAKGPLCPCATKLLGDECYPLYSITADNRFFVEPRAGAAPAPSEAGYQTIA
jgi:hypothetical protein